MRDGVIDGKAVAHAHRQQLKTQIAELNQHGVRPALVVFFVGKNPSAEPYFRSKLKLADSLGITVYPRRVRQPDEDVLVRWRWAGPGSFAQT